MSCISLSLDLSLQIVMHSIDKHSGLIIENDYRDVEELCKHICNT